MYTKRLVVATILTVVIFGAVYGLAAAMGVGGVDYLGAGSQSVYAPPDVDDVVWVISSSDYRYVDKVTISFGAAITNPTIYVYLTDSGGSVISSGSGSWTGSFDASAQFTVDVGDVLATNVYDIEITVTAAG